jgi:hypothetical protein
MKESDESRRKRKDFDAGALMSRLTALVPPRNGKKARGTRKWESAESTFGKLLLKGDFRGALRHAFDWVMGLLYLAVFLFVTMILFNCHGIEP